MVVKSFVMNRTGFLLIWFVMLISPFNLFSQKSNAGENIDIYYGRFFFEPNLTSAFLKGSVTYYFKVKNTADTISFDFNDTMQVDSVIIDGNVAGGYFFDGGLLKIVYAGMTAGNIDSISIYYHGYAVPAEGEVQAYFFATQSTNDTVPVLWTLSEPYGAKQWFPCKQHLSDKIDSIDVFIRHDAGYLGVSNGMLAGQYNDNGKVVTHWHHSYPIETYLIAIAVSRYSVYTITYHDSIYGYDFPVVNYIYPDMEIDTENVNFITKAIAFYVSLVGEYPFKNEKYGQLICGIHGGMEHQTVTFLEDFGFELVVHELAHMWFGDYITCKSWHDIWLNEGFATYFTGLCYEKFYPDMYWMPWKKITLDAVVSEPGGSVYCDDTTDVGRIFDFRLSYRKGAYLLHMLRWELGDSAFFTALRNYLADTSLAYSYATVNDLKYYLEAAGDTSLDEFFADWYYSQGYPVFDITYNQDDDNLLLINVLQSPSYGSTIFDITVPLVIYHDGEDTLIKIDVHNSSEIREIPLSYKVDSISFDPELWILAPHDNVVHPMLVPDENADNVKVFPNPVSDKVYVDVDNGLYSVRIFNMSGKIIVSSGELTGQSEFDLRDYSPGNYVLVITTADGNRYFKKIVKKQ